MNNPFKLGREFLPYPNGGGLKAMANKPRESQRLEVEALEAKHKAEIAKLKEKHAKENNSMNPKMGK